MVTEGLIAVAPARLLREGELQEVGPAVIGAARAFLVGG